jgi:hypothetical protein
VRKPAAAPIAAAACTATGQGGPGPPLLRGIATKPGETCSGLRDGSRLARFDFMLARHCVYARVLYNCNSVVPRTLSAGVQQSSKATNLGVTTYRAAGS